MSFLLFYDKISYMHKYIIFLLLCYSSCTSNKINKTKQLENQVEYQEDSFKIDLSDLNVGSVKREMIAQQEELDDSEIIEEITNSINIFLTDEEKRFFDLGKKAPVISRAFTWPLQLAKRVSSGFGMRNKKMHKGIDIPAPKNTQIIASNDGIVSFSGKKKGYGNVVILKHDNNIFSIYAHNSKNLIPNNKLVKKGEVIALVGSTGKSTGNHLHFEIREGTKPINPITFLKNQKQ